MRFRSLLIRATCCGAVCLALAGAPAAYAQLFGKCRQAPSDCCITPETVMPKVDGERTPPPRADTTTEAPPEFAASRPPAALGETVSMRMLGNDLPISGRASILQIGTAPPPLTIPSPPLTIPGTSFRPGENIRADGAILYPSIRGFRISEDESPRPEDRIYLGFNYFDDVNAAINRRIGADVHHIRVYRETLGGEKTFLGGDASIGFRLPLDSLDADSGIGSINGSHTDIGDLSVILKYAFWQNRDTGSLASAGLMVTVPTGPNSFAGSHVTTFNDTILQPWIGGIWALGDWYVHGFSSIDIATDSHDVTYWFNDIGVGYFLYKDSGNNRRVTAVVPTLEVHLTDPLNHRGAFRLTDLAATSDVVDITAGVTVELNHRSTLALGFVTPVTGPKPFSWEVLVQLNYAFGGGRPAGYPPTIMRSN
jgi:hypothetical protein